MLFRSPEFPASDEDAASLINRMENINRIIVTVWTADDPAKMQSVPSFLTEERLERLRHADAVVRKLTLESGFDDEVWQFPVVLIPFGTPGRPDSVVLRPIHSVDGMTASAVRMSDALLEQITHELRQISGIGGVFGARLVQVIDPKILRVLVLLVGSALTIGLFLRAYSFL